MCIRDSFKGRKDTHLEILTFQDNEALSDSERETILDYKVRGFINPDLENYDTEHNIKSEFWANKWRVYGLGLTGKIDGLIYTCLLYTSPSPRDRQKSRMPSSA